MSKTIIKKCSRHGDSVHVLRNKESRMRCRKCAVEAVQKRRNKVKQMAVDYLGGKCKKCGYNKCIAALEFHHKDPSKKEFGISAKGHCRSWKRVKKELDKCDLLCANCHREVEYTSIEKGN